MKQYFAFLRGINVGGHTVRMEDLRKMFEGIGFFDVATFIASGNVIFNASARSAAALERQIEEHLLGGLGYAAATFLRTASELEAITRHPSFEALDRAGRGSTLHVMLLREEPPADFRRKVAALTTASDELVVHGRELYWLCHTRLSDSPLFKGSIVDKTIGMQGTMRNANTVRKLLAKYPPAP
jgi:uncharacterized protein (DUF1697 family)